MAEEVTVPASQERSMPPMAVAMGPCRAGIPPYMNIQVMRMPAKKAMNAEGLMALREVFFESRKR